MRAQVGVQIVPVFISVDPERDTPEKIKGYVKVSRLAGGGRQLKGEKGKLLTVSR